MGNKAAFYLALLCTRICFSYNPHDWSLVGHYQESYQEPSERSHTYTTGDSGSADNTGWDAYRENNYSYERDFDHCKDFAVDQYRDGQRENGLLARESLYDYKVNSNAASFDSNQRFRDQLPDIRNSVITFRELHDFYQVQNPGYADCLQQRVNAIIAETNCSQLITDQYQLSSQVAQLLERNHVEIALYKQCCGNKVQRVMHQECIILLQEVANVPEKSLAASYQDALVECVDAARSYTSAGSVLDAFTITDFCWAFLDYSKAILEGVAYGVFDAAKDCIDHPIHTAACMVAGEYVLAYQLSKLLCNIAKIGAIYCVDQTAGACEWDNYMQPIHDTWSVLKKGKVSVRNALKGGVRFGACFLAQGKLLGGLGKLYKTAEGKAAEWLRNNPLLTPHEYMITPEGQLFKVISAKAKEQTKLSNVLKAEGEHIGGGRISNLPFVFSEEAIDQGVKHIMKDSSKVIHIFNKSMHNLDPLVAKLGDHENCVRSILKALSGKLPKNAIFKDMMVSISGYRVYVRGRVINGIPKLGTFFIKKEELM